VVPISDLLNWRILQFSRLLVSEVIELLAVWRHNKPKTKNLKNGVILLLFSKISEFLGQSYLYKSTVTTNLGLNRLYTSLQTTFSQAHTALFNAVTIPTPFRLGLYMTVTRQCRSGCCHPVSNLKKIQSFYSKTKQQKFCQVRYHGRSRFKYMFPVISVIVYVLPANNKIMAINMFVDGQSAISRILGSDKQTRCTENPRKKVLQGVKARRPYPPLAISSCLP